MRSEALQTIEQENGCKIEIHREEHPESPREWDNAGTMVCFHGRYKLGDDHDFSDPEDAKQFMDEVEDAGGVVLSLFLYDHSGITMSTKPFSCPWDSGQVGWIYVEAKTIKSEWGDTTNERAIAHLEAEIKTFDQYLCGEVYGYVLCCSHGGVIDSCWGYFGIEDTIEAAKEMLPIESTCEESKDEN